MKGGSSIKAYVTNSDQSYSSNDVCNMNSVSSENLSFITCDTYGSNLWIVAESGIIELYAVAIFKDSLACYECASDFKFIPNQQSLSF